MTPERTFLVSSGYNFRAVLAFCRALKRAGMRPAIVACTLTDPIFKTSFAGDVVFTRQTRTLDVADFAAATRIACKYSGASRCVLAPTSEYLIRWAYAQREALATAGCDLPLPDESVYTTVTDKAAFTAFARTQGLPVPDELAAVAEEALPAVAKPRWNVSPDGRSLYPWLLRTPADLKRFQAHERAGDYFFQEWVEGRSFYLLFHLTAAGTATVYSQENLAQQPGGKSILFARAATLHASPEAERWAGALRAVGFHGLVMIELRRRGGDYVLIEANPRLWGPLQLCLDGCPALLLNYIAGQCGIHVPARASVPDSAAPAYLWLGGLPAGKPDWHGPRPLFPRARLLGGLGSDVYLRADSWRHFFHELKPSAPLPPATAARPAALVAIP
jgi:hypothetical protein